MTGEAWRRHLQTYLALRRAIGFTMQREAPLLQDFVEHLERRGDDAPVAQVAVEWASASTESQHARRLSIVRGFLTMVRAAEPDVNVPGAGLVRTCKRPIPRILAPDEIVALMDARPLPRTTQCATFAHRRHRDRAAGEPWPPRQRGDSPRHRSRRSRRYSAVPPDSAHQVPEVAPRAAPSHDCRRAAGLRRTTPGSRLRRLVQRLLCRPSDYADVSADAPSWTAF